ncbi:MAG: phosphatidylglycerophosphatase A [Alphaproteobacteria bacterium]|nr:phosphatidylglycerophosphatase A [Alphaproteobacteria bacterium]
MRFRDPSALIATWFGAGLLPGIPGTWGSLAALPFGILLLVYTGAAGLFAAAVVLFFVGKWAADVYVRLSGDEDPGPVVVDEVVGQWLCLMAIHTGAWWEFVLAFLLFRVFDILKPWPVDWAERRFAAGLGVMLDDVFAGLYAFISLALIVYLYYVIFSF